MDRFEYERVTDEETAQAIIRSSGFGEVGVETAATEVLTPSERADVYKAKLAEFRQLEQSLKDKLDTRINLAGYAGMRFTDYTEV
jgi:hypothetical protein